ncbi:hypothetical protein [Methylocapsa sp. S129]|uniref:hypothetical protein n=1 Tax=Methylocapsa sp. S129 TaxID=1641869 RepID=UPI00131B8CE8|nr:hypothetical protein [Methylocapsa sp. S129]
MRNAILAGIAGLFLAFGAINAHADTSISPDASWPDAANGQLIEGRAAYENSVNVYGQLGNDFGPGFNYGAPASPHDFAGTEIRRDQ